MYPPLPQIRGEQDIYLDVNTHKSLRAPPDPSEAPDYGDTDRLCILGEHAMGMLVAQHLFAQSPLLSATEMKQKQAVLLDADNYKTWIRHYKLRLLAPPGMSPLEDNKEAIDFFNTYVGAVYHRNGSEEVRQWISGLLDPYGSVRGMDNPNHDNADPATNQLPTYEGSQQSHTSQPFSQHPGTPNQYQQQPGFTQPFPAGPPPPTDPAPPLPTSGPPPSLPNGVSSLITLAVVNQTVAQRGMVITYEPNPPVGPAHSPVWTVRCMINGVERGRGQGKSQKLAKEEAARQAWVNMGW